MAKLIKAVFGAGQTSKTCPQWQYDYNTVLQFVGLDLPASYEVDLSNSKTGQSTTVLGDANGCVIPAQYFIPGTSIFAWVYVVGDDYGYTRCQVEIPIAHRAVHTGDEPTPAQQSALDAAIALLNQAAEDLAEAQEAIPNEIDEALEEAKASGDFDGPQGPQGPQGERGPEGPRGPAGQDAVVDATLTQAGEAADAAAAGAGIRAAQHSADYARLFAETLNNGDGIPLDVEWVQGDVGGFRPYRAHSIRTVTSTRLVLQAADGYRFYVRSYSGGSYTDSNWYGPAYSRRQTYTLPEGTDCVIVAGYYPEDTSITADPATLGAAITIVNNIGSGSGGGTVRPYTGSPAALGTASPGTSNDYARGDHVHPKPTAAEIGAYAKPSGGIPKTDMASDVQTSLGKANTALQHQSLSAYRTAEEQNLIDRQLAAAIPTKTSELQNDSGYLTQHQDISGKLDRAQGAANAGKFLIVGSDGNIALQEMTNAETEAL